MKIYLTAIAIAINLSSCNTENPSASLKGDEDRPSQLWSANSFTCEDDNFTVRATLGETGATPALTITERDATEDYPLGEFSKTESAIGTLISAQHLDAPFDVHYSLVVPRYTFADQNASEPFQGTLVVSISDGPNGPVNEFRQISRCTASVHQNDDDDELTFIADFCGDNEIQSSDVSRICFGFSEDGRRFWDRVEIDGRVHGFEGYSADEDELWVEFEVAGVGFVTLNYQDGDVVSIEADEGIRFQSENLYQP